jgi:4-amino-4-deoxy-L-arabinose transferase-like glycosyltransferase
MTTTSGNRPSRKELVALGTASTFGYVGAFVSFYLAGKYAIQNTWFEVFWWISGVCWFLPALVLPAWFGYRLAKRQRWNGVIVVTLAVLPWIVLSGGFIIMVAMIASHLE